MAFSIKFTKEERRSETESKLIALSITEVELVKDQLKDEILKSAPQLRVDLPASTIQSFKVTKIRLWRYPMQILVLEI